MPKPKPKPKPIQIKKIKKIKFIDNCVAGRWRETGLIVKMASIDLSLQLSLHLIKFLSLCLMDAL